MQLLGLRYWQTLLLQIPLGVLLYVGGSVLLKLDSFTYILSIVRRYLPGRRQETQE